MAVEGFVGPCNESGIASAPKRQTVFPDLVIAIYGSGRSEARLRGSNDVIDEAPSTAALVTALKLKFPAGFDADFRYDPHM
jgi:hypothetical protein